MYNKDEIKESLTIEQVFDLVSELGGEPHPIIHNSYFISKTICHNTLGEGSYKLYYYDNSHLFKCYTDCDDSFDIFELVAKVKKNNDNSEWSLPKCIAFVGNYFRIFNDYETSFDEENKIEDWNIINAYSRKKIDNIYKIDKLKTYDDKIINFLPSPIISPWEQEGIARKVIKNRNIKYDPVTESIIIPHYNKEGELVGIRKRTLIKELELYGKYTPAYLNRILYNHPLSFNLYNLNNSKNAIKVLQKAIVYEGKR